MKKAHIILLVVLAVLLISVAWWAFVGITSLRSQLDEAKRDFQKASQAHEDTEAMAYGKIHEEDIQDWETWNSSYGSHVKYPKDWKIEDGGEILEDSRVAHYTKVTAPSGSELYLVSTLNSGGSELLLPKAFQGNIQDRFFSAGSDALIVLNTVTYRAYEIQNNKMKKIFYPGELPNVITGPNGEEAQFAAVYVINSTDNADYPTAEDILRTWTLD